MNAQNRRYVGDILEAVLAGSYVVGADPIAYRTTVERSLISLAHAGYGEEIMDRLGDVVRSLQELVRMEPES